jgi:hypothetical protein
MATNFPTSVDVLTNPVSNDSLNSPSHSAQHANANDAIEAIEGVLVNGVNAWTSFTPVLNATSGTITSYVINRARYAQIGKIVHVNYDVTVTNNGTGSETKELTLPITAANENHGGGGIDLVTGIGLVVFLVSSTKVRFANYNYTYPNAISRLSITYEAA